MILSSYALQVLPVEWFGIALILLASVLVVLDLKVTGHGLPTVGGMALLILGILMLLDPTNSYYLPASLVALVAVAILVGIAFVGGLSEVRATRGRPAITGIEGMIGEVGVVREPVGTGSPGWVLVLGERWQATTTVAPEDAHKQDREQMIGVGRRVQVVDVRDGQVVVRPFEPAPFVQESG